MRDEVGGDEAATDASSDAVTEDEEEEEEEDNAEGEEVVVVVMPEVEVEVEVPDIYVLEVVKEFDHDHLAFTQGFLYNQECSSEEASCKDMFYESTGLNGQTSVRMVNAGTGRVEAKTMAEQRFFGEGLTRWGEKLYQLTWQSGATLVYDAETLEFLEETKTDLKDGWGLTNDSSHLIATDSGHTLYFLDPETLKTDHKVDVADGDRRVKYLNELEHVEGEVWANIWMRNCIARIDPATGKVKGWIHAADLTAKELVKSDSLGRRYTMDVLNGIAYDPATKRIWLTGKQWSTVYEVKVVPLSSSPSLSATLDLNQVRRECIV
mmetsp:Transcript_7820/g.22365  ORF Transcript_7820/g.22365 Transcript_7820/m.22365 type:complete len:322 (-) Transcript_7820:170-1135(-)